ncbi:penicillin-binding protein 1C [Pseudochelatococcus lubricantis]|uniref:peptidoglycan glycosyltransferase n=1 Tax=Pseudochelatococcus lubricantis TaxID=1538102 RepID=A0ABX0V1N0_9HYPH|nr:penicillin-binding protein 1C [Pseudochelatococcus lubricantis]
MIRRLAATAGAVALVAALLAGGALWRFAASLPPLDLAAARQYSTVVLDRHGAVLRAFTFDDGRWRLPATVADVDPRFLDLLMAYEDRRFRRHHGVDPLATSRAAIQMLATGRIVSGGSTLTMQVARLMEPRTERTMAAKLRQAVRAIELERHFSKDGILAFYLGLAPYGGNLEGVRAASLAYFGKEPRRLSVAEAALLVALPQSPEARRPDRFPGQARAARGRVLKRAFERGLIGAAEMEAALAAPVPTARRSFPMLAAHVAQAERAANPEAGTLRLTIDAGLQAGLETLAREAARRIGPQISAAIVAVDNSTGEVLAHVGAADIMASERAGWVDAAKAVRSPGSALKPFIYALAFEAGLAHPETVLEDRPTRYGLYAPENFDQTFQGTVTARKALQLSLNVPAVALLAEVGPAHLLARLRAAGVAVELPKDGGEPGLAIALGGLGIRLTDLARAYAGLARGGKVPALRYRLDSEIPAAAEPAFVQPVAAWYVADILRGAPAPHNAPAGRIAYKTGTSYGYRDAVAAGFDRNTTIAVWLGRPDGGAVPGLLARHTAAPLLFEAFARLGRDSLPVIVPEGRLTATSATLPPPLRHLRRDAPRNLMATISAPLRIAFPPDGALIDLGLEQEGGQEAVLQELALKASGGIPPLTWMVNGRPVEQGALRRETRWRPDGEGFAWLSVIDARGSTDNVTVRIR